ncbi:EAL-associated domain-containing protein [Neobacillus sp. SM06]|uniref:EAL domain-containing protein n=1 Tax=Neobacillus sp. SM06 TaxID=3422492 RepID=UPI003D2CAEC7
MDPLDILTDLENVVPFFQPIFSADEQRVMGYEVVGRYFSDGQIISLGSFFQDEQIPDEYKVEVDQLLLKKALDKALTANEDVSFFFNRSAGLLMYEHGEPLLNELLEYEKKGINLKRIVLEISEDNYPGDLDQFDHLLRYYRTYGIKIAIEKMGSDSSYLDRVSQLEPDILKVNLRALRSEAKGNAFNDVLYSLSLLARKIGAALLFENIEMEYQLQFAWKNGGRYYQGFYLSFPNGELVDRDLLKDRLKAKFHDFITYEKRKLEKFYFTAEEFQAKVLEIVQKAKKGSSEELFELLIKEMNQIAFRMYICDEDGFQNSPNIFKTQHGWVTQNEYIGKNWSWRPYFLENIIRMRNERKGILSDLYCDIETGETIRTFSFPLTESGYLFIDISYHYLFEHEELL